MKNFLYILAVIAMTALVSCGKQEYDITPGLELPAAYDIPQGYGDPVFVDVALTRVPGPVASVSESVLTVEVKASQPLPCKIYVRDEHDNVFLLPRGSDTQTFTYEIPPYCYNDNTYAPKLKRVVPQWCIADGKLYVFRE